MKFKKKYGQCLCYRDSDLIGWDGAQILLDRHFNSVFTMTAASQLVKLKGNT